MAKTMNVTINRDGEIVLVDVKGTVGTQCVDMTKDLLKSLSGEDTNIKVGNKPELKLGAAKVKRTVNEEV